MNQKTINNLLWWIPFKKLRTFIREYIDFVDSINNNILSLNNKLSEYYNIVNSNSSAINFIKNNTLDSKLPDSLEKFGYKIYSESNEDGIIDEIFNRIGIIDKYFVEIGIKNGIINNSTLLLYKGWSGVFIEENRENCNNIKNNFFTDIINSNLSVLNTKVNVDNINEILYKSGCTFRHLDFLSINIYNAYNILNTIDIVLPNVVALKYDSFTESLKMITELANNKGYYLVGINSINTVAFFVKKELCKDQFPNMNLAYIDDKKLLFGSNIEFEYKDRFLPTPSTNSMNSLLAISNDLIDLKNIKTVFEFGSRYGEDTITFAKKLPNAKIYGFECNPNTLDECKLRVSKHNNIILTESAVSDSDGTITFYSINKDKTKTTHLDGNQGASSTLKASGKYPIEEYAQDEVTVKSIRLDTFMKKNNIDTIDILWMDVQGGELNALKGLGDRINDVKIIYSEVEFMEMYENQPLFDDIKNYLTSKNFYFLGFMDKCEYFSNAIFVHKNYYKDISFNILEDQTRPDQTRIIYEYSYKDAA